MTFYNFDADFNLFFDEKLTPLLQVVKAEGRIADNWGISIIVAAMLGFASFLLMQMGLINSEGGGILITVFIILTIIAVYQYANHNDRFTDDIKYNIIATILEHIQPGIIYKPEQVISHQDYINSSLVRYRYKYYNGSDYMEGMYKNVFFHCSQVHSQTDSGGLGDIDQPTIFKGLVFVAAINSGYSECTYIWNRQAVQLASSIMDQSYRLFSMPEVYDLAIADTKFREKFRVCSTEPSEATEIITMISPEAILEFIEQIQRLISLSFVQGNCYIAIPFEQDIFGPSQNVPGDKEETKLYFNAVKLIFDLIDHLHLDLLQ